jgi:DNA-binding Lrp family transcriptional regulator
MQTQPQPPSQRHGKTPLVYPQIFSFLSMLYHGLVGWCQVATIEGDPSHGATRNFRRWWYRIDDIHDLELLSQELGDTGHRGLNVYVSSTLYATKNMSKATALPSRVLFIDDAPREPEKPYTLTYSMLVQTSPASYQAYYFLDERLNHDSREQHQAALAAHLHADPSGADVTQIVRIPGGYNTKAKYGDPYPCALRWCDGKRHSLTEIEAIYPTSIVEINKKIPQIDIELWHGNIQSLLDDENIPSRITNPQYIRDNFKRALDGNYYNDNPKDGKPRIDKSGMRQTLANSLSIKGYQDEVIAAFLAYYTPDDSKSESWLIQDIKRCISLARVTHAPKHGINPVGVPKSRNGAKPIISNEPQLNHRRAEITARKLWQWYESRAIDTDVINLKLHEVAQELCTSNRTITRRERELEKAGLLKRYTVRHQSYVRLFRHDRSPNLDMTEGTQNDAFVMSKSPSHMALESQKTAIETVEIPTIVHTALAVGRVCTIPTPPPPLRSSVLSGDDLRSAVWHVHSTPRLHTDERTGQVRNCVVSFVIKYIHSIDASVDESLIKEIHKQVMIEKGQLELEQWFLGLPTKTMSELNKERKVLVRKRETAKAKGKVTKIDELRENHTTTEKNEIDRTKSPFNVELLNIKITGIEWEINRRNTETMAA